MKRFMFQLSNALRFHINCCARWLRFHRRASSARCATNTALAAQRGIIVFGWLRGPVERFAAPASSPRYRGFSPR
jgi:hypothetical protein